MVPSSVDELVVPISIDLVTPLFFFEPEHLFIPLTSWGLSMMDRSNRLKDILIILWKFVTDSLIFII